MKLPKRKNKREKNHVTDNTTPGCESTNQDVKAPTTEKHAVYNAIALLLPVIAVCEG
jgi:hypothetical protein